MNSPNFDDFIDVPEKKQSLTTSCKDCVFASKEDKTQTGCELNRIEAFESRGTVVIEAEDMEENEFYVIESWCNAYREDIWAKANEGEDLIEAVSKEMYPKIGFLILVRDDLDGYEKTINSILNQEKFPAKHIVTINAGNRSYFELIKKTNEILEDSEIQYKVQDIRNAENPSDEEIIDEAFVNAKFGFYTLVECGKELPLDLIAVLNNWVTVNLKKAAYIEGYDGINGLTVQTVMHKFLAGNKGASLKQKIKEGEEFDQAQESLIRTWDELRCQN